MKSQVIQGNCLDRLKELPENSVDSIVTDPPYELGFMGKSWDSTGIANNKEMWAECLRVLKPGGHLLAFSGTRTYHRMASAIEDAGFEVRDMIEWVYGSGFPKSLNIGKAVDKMGNKIGELYNFTKWFDDVCKEKGITNKQLDEYLGLNSGGSTCSHYRGWNTQQPRYPREEHFKKLKEWMGFGDLWDEKIAEVEREVVGTRKVPSGHAFAGEQYGGSENIDFNDTKGTSPWEGWGTALKPAHEPICMARKPLAEKTVAENVLKYGTGGINIDESRVEGKLDGDPNRFAKTDGGWGVAEFHEAPVVRNEGRFPANLIHDNSEEVRGCFPESKGDSLTRKPRVKYATTQFGFGNGTDEGIQTEGKTDSGNASRFFKSIIYQAKSSKSERTSGGTITNQHPTIKPIALMEYLIKMVTPKGGIVLDPFAGSGSTLVAAKQNGYEYIGIELTPEYIPIINARLK